MALIDPSGLSVSEPNNLRVHGLFTRKPDLSDQPPQHRMEPEHRFVQVTARSHSYGLFAELLQ
jgi:hypothetical protein